jgi:hypothetical protein
MHCALKRAEIHEAVFASEAKLSILGHKEKAGLLRFARDDDKNDDNKGEG